MIRQLLIQTKNEQVERRQKAVETLMYIAPSDAENIIRALSPGLVDAEVGPEHNQSQVLLCERVVPVKEALTQLSGMCFPKLIPGTLSLIAIMPH